MLFYLVIANLQGIFIPFVWHNAFSLKASVSTLSNVLVDFIKYVYSDTGLRESATFLVNSFLNYLV